MVCRILVADDSTPIQKVIRIGLADIPNETKAVGSFMEAVKAVDGGRFDLIIADAGLPGVSAASDFIKLSERAGQIPLIILMGSYDAVRESDLRAVGIQNIVKKPFPTGELPALVKSLINTQASASPQAPAPSIRLPDPFQSPPAQAQSAPQPVTFDLGSMDPAAGIPPLPLTEPARKGRPAFADDPFSSQSSPHKAIPQTTPLMPDLPEVSLGSGGPVAGVSAALANMVREELPVLVDRAVERYCAEHFRDVAREVLTNEIRRLAEEKARYLVDQ
jgi:DNA-binding response OmpR family regulator